MVLSHDTSSCSYILVALPPPSDAVPARWCVSTPVMRAAVCLLYVSAVKRRRVAGLRVCHSRHSLGVCSCCVAVCRALACTCMISLCVALRRARPRSVSGLRGGMTASDTCGLSGCVGWGSLAHGVVRER